MGSQPILLCLLNTLKLEYLLIVTMTHLTIHNLDENIKAYLQEQAEKHGRSLEEEVKEILQLTLTNQESPLNIVTMLERRFAHCGDFELPEIPREPIRQTPTFEE